MKTWKIMLLTIGTLVVLFIGLVIYNGYQYYDKFYDDAEDLRPITFRSEIFNSKLKNCGLAYGDSWEIRGIENNKCVVNFKWSSDANYSSGSISSNWVVCELPYGIYSSSINWNDLIYGEYCDF